MKETVIHLPQTDAMGLSENWLFKHCGEMHWDYLCAAMGVSGVNSEAMRDDAGSRLYPTFVAIKARYARPLSTVAMDQHFRTEVDLSHFGRAFFHSTVAFSNDETRCDLEMLTTFASRHRPGVNELHRSLPASTLAYSSKPLSTPPPILKASQALRHSDASDYVFAGHHVARSGSGLGLRASFEPSPYSDYNGAGLLYFAAYPTIADTLERQLITRHGLRAGKGDWAVTTSTVARDVFYHRNLDLGHRLTATLRRFEPVGRELIILHTVLAAESDGALLADVFTAKRVLGPCDTVVDPARLQARSS